MRQSKYVLYTEYKKHLDGDWKTVHNLWRHIRIYGDDLGYSKVAIDAFFEGESGGKKQIDSGNVIGLTQSAIPYGAAGGGLTDDSSNFLWDAINKRLGVGRTPLAPLDIEETGTNEGGESGGALEVVGHFRNDTATKNTAISIDALTGYDPILYLAENGSAIWDIRNDASATDQFQIRYQVGAANSIYFEIMNNGHILLSIAGQQLKFLGTPGGGGEGILYKDSGGLARYGLLFEATNVVALVNRAANGVVHLRANAAGSGLGGEVTQVIIEDTHITVAGFVNSIGGFKDNGVAGIDTTFLDQDGNTITVKGGIVTAKTAP